jgi:hypothetical protein
MKCLAHAAERFMVGLDRRLNKGAWQSFFWLVWLVKVTSCIL